MWMGEIRQAEEGAVSATASSMLCPSGEQSVSVMEDAMDPIYLKHGAWAHRRILLWHCIFGGPCDL